MSDKMLGVKNNQIDRLLKANEKLEQQSKQLREENEKLRKCVEFYADKDNWCGYHPNRKREEINPDDCDKQGEIRICGGKLARKTLKELGGSGGL